MTSNGEELDGDVIVLLCFANISYIRSYTEKKRSYAKPKKGFEN